MCVIVKHMYTVYTGERNIRNSNDKQENDQKKMSQINTSYIYIYIYSPHI